MVGQLATLERKCRFRVGVLFATVCAATGCGSPPEFAEARAQLERVQTEIQAMNQAIAAADQYAIVKHQAEAGRLLRSARYLYESAHAAKADDPVVLAGYADVLQQSRDYDLAAEVYRRLTLFFPNDPTLWFNLARSLSELGEPSYAEAKSAFERAIELDPKSQLTANAYSGLGALYRRMGLHDFAREYYSQGLAIDPSDFRTRIVVGGILAREGRIKEASDFLEAGGVIPAEFGQVLQDTLGAALTDFQSNRQWFPDEAANHFAYARLLVLAGRVGEALAPLERAVALDATNYVAWNLLGAVAGELGYAGRAREAYQRSLGVNADQPKTREKLNQLPNPEL